MPPLEQVTVLVTLMRRLGQVMDHERAILGTMRLDALPEIQEEKAALAEAYEIELGRLRRTPDVIAALDGGVRERLHEAMREFQDTVTANLNALVAAQSVIDRILRHIGDSLATNTPRNYGRSGEVSERPAGGAQVISLAFDRQC